MRRVIVLFGLLVGATLSTLAEVSDAKYEKISGQVVHGEGPHWNAADGALYWVDIDKGEVWRHHAKTNEVTKCTPGGQVTMVVPVEGMENTFIISVLDGLQQLTWDGKNDSTIALRPLVSMGPLPGTTRLNDGKADAKGRLWVGSIGPEENNTVEENVAKLYLVSCAPKATELQVSVQLENVTVSNGIAWSGDGAIMYYIDTPTRKIDAFDFDAEEGKISNRRTVFDLNAHNITGLPDGMTIDVDDNLWIALYLGGGVIQVNPHLSRLLHIFPLEGVEKVTSVSWGGKDLDVLYVTSSSRDSTAGGELYKLTGTGIHGKPANNFKLDTCKKEDKS